MRLFRLSLAFTAFIFITCAGGTVVGPNNCDGDPCNGRGSCALVADGAECTCNNGYAGLLCEDCATGFEQNGDACQAIPDPCGSVSCMNGGSCDAGSCACPPGWTGTACDTAESTNTQALLCDGVDDGVVVDMEDTMTSLTQLTVEYWFRIDPLADPMAEREDVILGAAGIDAFPHLEASIFFVPEVDVCSLAFNVATTPDSGTTVDNTQIAAGTPCETGTWHHYAVTLDSNTGVDAEVFVDGVSITEQNLAAPAELYVSPDTLYVCGYTWGGFTGDRLRGAVDSIRVSSIVRYTDDFTPESNLTSDADTLVLFSFNGSIIDESSPANILTTEGSPTLEDY